MAHLAFIWALAAPLFLVVFGYQAKYQDTTAIAPQLTLTEFRLDPSRQGTAA